MSDNSLPVKAQNYLAEFIRRNAIDKEAFMDKMFINYLQFLKIDEDYLHKKIENNRNSKINNSFQKVRFHNNY